MQASLKYDNKHEETGDAFALYNKSFDTISDAGGYPKCDGHAEQEIGKGSYPSAFATPMKTTNGGVQKRGCGFEKTVNKDQKDALKPPPREIVHARTNDGGVFDADISPIPLEADPSFEDANRRIQFDSHGLPDGRSADNSFARLHETEDHHGRESHPREVSFLEHDPSAGRQHMDQALDLSTRIASPVKRADHRGPQLAPRANPYSYTGGHYHSRPSHSDYYHPKATTGYNATTPPPSRTSTPQYQGRPLQASPITGDFAPGEAYSHSLQMAYYPHQFQQPSHLQYAPRYQYHQQQHHFHFAGQPLPRHQLYPSNPLFVLRTMRKAFGGCTYLLGCLRDPNINQVNVRQNPPGPVHYEEQQKSELHPDKLKVATRRVQSAICALGGYLKSQSDVNISQEAAPVQSVEPAPSTTRGKGNSKKQASSIFRRTQRPPQKSSTATSTSRGDNNETALPPNAYNERFHQRYSVTGTRVSWDVEENPPISVPSDELEAKASKNRQAQSSLTGGDFQSSPASRHGRSAADLSSSPSDHRQKMKYRCKACGQPKYNHECPYEKSLQRSIGVMVFPATNAFTSSEPGVLTPALSEMNNFVAYGGNSGSSDFDVESGNASKDSHHQARSDTAARVTPEYRLRGGMLYNSPESSTLSSSTYSPHYPPTTVMVTSQGPVGRGHGKLKPASRLSLNLRPEHFRAVTSRRPPKGSRSVVGTGDNGPSQVKETVNGSFEYPHVALTFKGRKRLSDTLFYLAKNIPTLTADVASILRTAREKDEWDLAVAEVLTEVIVSLFCREGDHCLDGLQHYLSGIGIST